MSRLALCLLLLATGASAEQLPRAVGVFHDDERGATCWIASVGMGIGISCIPDIQLRVGNEHQLYPHEPESEPTPILAPERRVEVNSRTPPLK